VSEREEVIPSRSDLAAETEAALSYLHQNGYQRFGEKLAVAALSGIPWIGGVLSAVSTLKTEEGQLRATQLLRQWVASHEELLGYLDRDMSYVISRIELLGPEAEARAESPEYLKLVRKAFQSWDRADTDKKRHFYAKLLARAAGSRLCPDDTVRLFIDWIERYHEAHFAMIRYVYQHPGCTKFDIGTDLLGAPLPADNSAEADLFRELFRELNMGAIIRQPRESDAVGRFLRAAPAKSRRPASKVLESSFEDSKQQVLSEMGRQFVHYVMDEVVPRLPDP
jgi:hypothetical protein